MSTISFVIDVYPIYAMFQQRLTEKVGRKLRSRVSIEMVTDDFFDICMQMASDAIQHVEIGEQRLLLNPVGRVRQMVSTQLQDIFFDQLAEYTAASEYFQEYEVENLFLGNDVASLGVYVIDEILREIMSTLVQYPEGAMYFDSYRCTTNADTIADVVFNRPNQRSHDIHVFMGFE